MKPWITHVSYSSEGRRLYLLHVILQLIMNLTANWQLTHILFTHQFLLAISAVSVPFGPWTPLYPHPLTNKRHTEARRPSICAETSIRSAVWLCASRLHVSGRSVSDRRNITAHFRSHTRFISHCLCLCIIILCVRFCMKKKSSQVSTCSFAGRAGVTVAQVWKHACRQLDTLPCSAGLSCIN